MKKQLTLPATAVVALLAAVFTTSTQSATAHDKVNLNDSTGVETQLTEAPPTTLSGQEVMDPVLGEKAKEAQFLAQQADPNHVNPLAATATPLSALGLQVNQKLAEITDRYSDVHARTFANEEAGVYELSYLESADKDRVAGYMGEINELFAANGAEVVYKPATYTLAHNTAVLDKVIDYLSSEDSPVSVRTLSGAPDFLGDGVIRIGIESDTDSETTKALSDKFSELLNAQISITVSDEPVFVSESRTHDTNPFSPGARIYDKSGTPQCTLGFGWRKWSNNRLYNSTAAHCWSQTGINNFYNNGTLLGTRYTTSVTDDAMLLTPPAGIEPSTYVLVGPPNSSTIYPLRGASVLSVGNAVGFSGATTGTHVTSVASLNAAGKYTSPYLGKVTVRGLTATWSRSTDGGDSGGIWITSDEYNNAYAHGMHFGRGNIPGIGWYSAYVDVNRISGALQATIYIQ